MQDQAGIAFDEKHMVDLVAQGVLEHDVCVRQAAAPCLDAPADAARCEGALQHAIHVAHEATQCLGNGLADDPADHREQRQLRQRLDC